MRVEPLVPDVSPRRDAAAPMTDDVALFGAALDGLGGALAAAQHAEDAFANGAGSCTMPFTSALAPTLRWR